MKKKKENPERIERLLTRRTFFLMGGKALLGTTLLARLGYLGIIRGPHYQTLADENRIKLQLLLPQRGTITDRTGTELANSDLNYQLSVTPDEITDVDSWARVLKACLPFEEGEFESLLEKMKKSPRYRPFLMKERLSWDEVCSVELNLPELDGVEIQQIHKRRYPYPFETSHLIGFVQIPQEGEEEDEALLRLPGYRVGKTGLEKLYNDSLKGKAGYREVEVNAHRRIIRDLSYEESEPGSSLTLSIDFEIQKKIYDLLSAHQSGSALVMDAWTGELLAFVSYPGFDSNVFVDGISRENWKELQENSTRPLTNKAIHGLYEPASTFKSVVGLAGLESRKITGKTHVLCNGYVEVGGHRFHCWKKGGHGYVTLEQAIAQSCDVYFYEIGQTIGHKAILSMAETLGLGHATNIELPGERSGLIPSQDWMQKRFKRSWRKGDTFLLSIGHGNIMATPLQLAVLQARMITGYEITPTLFKSTKTRRDFPPINLKKENVELILSGLSQVVNEPWGTGFRARIEDPKLMMAGKTGTAQVRRISMKERASGVLKNDQLPWHLRDHALFLGYAPAHSPRYVCSVVVEHGGGGGGASAPIARDILFLVQKKKERGTV